ncbi:hypothetical protein Drorol1_Dr00014758 [Drosera rotundifolia]
MPLIHGGDDVCSWGDGACPAFSSAIVWDAIRCKGNVVNWHNLVWSSGYVSRHAFICWMVGHQRLKTQDRMIGMGRPDMVSCVFCDNEVETHVHLFFGCIFTRRLALAWSVLCSTAIPADPCNVIFWYMTARLKGNQFRKRFRRVMFCALVYRGLEV